MSQQCIVGITFAVLYSTLQEEARTATVNRERKLRERNRYVSEENAEGTFNVQHARNYARRALRGQGKATGSADRTDDKPSSQSHVNRVDENDVEDIAQTAFLFWWKRKASDDTCTLRRACRFAVGRYWRKASKGKGKGYGQEDCRNERRKREMASNTTGFKLVELTPFVASKRDAQIETLAKCLASGSTITDAAAILGVSQPYVSQKLLPELRARILSYKTYPLPMLPEALPDIVNGQTASLYAPDTTLLYNGLPIVPVNPVTVPTAFVTRADVLAIAPIPFTNASNAMRHMDRGELHALTVDIELQTPSLASKTVHVPYAVLASNKAVK